MQSSPEHDQRVMAVLEEARRRPPADRQNFLRSACGGDEDLYRELTETLEWDHRMGGFLQQPMLDFATLVRPFEPGQVIAERFEIVREVGEGGMGVVYEAFDRKRQQRIAIKAAKPGFQRLLSPELEGALKVRHPNICLVNEIHTAETEHGPTDFLTMEFLEGITLAAFLQERSRLRHKQALASHISFAPQLPKPTAVAFSIATSRARTLSCAATTMAALEPSLPILDCPAG